ncbi:MAG: phosphate ABC transporter, permease protein PstA [Hyphomicrobium sp.]|nr:phosphate ABC transporter, permease protein PstA [Hyphomicrobium sp.]PPC79888.1 MAG: phosphate ABC transporter, permease protein PstA [Hyphomicrobium sp.]
MTDISASNAMGVPKQRRVDVTSAAAQARVRARYRSEARFKACGLFALAITTVFVVVLMADIMMRGLPSFWQHRLVLDVPVAADAFGPPGNVDVAAIRGGDYFPVTKAALAKAIPGIESRSAEKQLNRLLSTGAPDVLRETLAANPALIGQTVKIPLLLSDDADLYFKGGETTIAKRNPRGVATPSGVNGEITVLTAANDFASELATVKIALAAAAARTQFEANRLSKSPDKTNQSRGAELAAEAKSLLARSQQSRGEETLDSKVPSVLVEINGGLVKATKLGDSSISGEVLLPLKSANEAKPDDWKIVTYVTPEANRKVTDQEVAFLERLKTSGAVENVFNWRFFTAGDSREPELAGIRGALVGTALTLFVTLILCLPIGVGAAVYLEEFAPKNRFTDLVEVNINNLAAVPSIVFGLLGLAVFLNFFGLPRSAPLVGGLVLALLVLPTIIIASRAALRSVPPSIKEAALGVGASHQQAIFHHVLPLAMPGIMTGTIIGMAHALGETAPLLMIGMIAFIVDVPQSFVESATVMPVQIYLWSDLPEKAFQAKTAGAIIVLLVFLFVMNGMAIWLRKRFERRW